MGQGGLLNRIKSNSKPLESNMSLKNYLNQTGGQDESTEI